MSDYQYLQYLVEKNVAYVVMNRPPVNAINLEMSKEINAAYRRSKDDADVHAVIITSALSNIFSAGIDLKAPPSNGVQLRNQMESFYFEMHDLLYRMGKPVIAAVTGHARGGGISIAVSTDIIIASEDARVGYPEIDVCTLPAMHLVHLPRQAGRHRAAKLLFTGDIVTAKDMQDLGVFNEVLPASDVRPAAQALAERLAKKSPIAMKMLRDAFIRANDLDYRRAMENVVDTMCALRNTEDWAEAKTARFECREPRFVGR
jgi:enoyl-CoA hydratase